MENAESNQELLENVTISEVGGSQFMIQRMTVDNTQLLNAELLSHHGGLVVDLGAGDFIPVNYSSEDLLNQDLTEEDRNLAAALVAVQLSQQQKQQQLQQDSSNTINQSLPGLTNTNIGVPKIELSDQQIILSGKAANTINSRYLQIVGDENVYETYDQDIKSEGETEPPAVVKDSDGENRSDNRSSRKSLPHKKRISRKLKRNPVALRKYHKCNLCEQTFSAEDFTEHQSVCHTTITPVNPTLFSCQLCQSNFQDQLSFFEHLKSHYEPSVQVEATTITPTIFSSPELDCDDDDNDPCNDFDLNLEQATHESPEEDSVIIPAADDNQVTLIPSTSENKEQTTSSAKLCYGKQNRQKDFCFYCKRLVQCFGRHVIRNHSSESEVQKILLYAPKNETRRYLLALLRKKGNYLYSNQAPKAVKKSVVEKSLLPCPECLGLYSRTQLWRHRRTCTKGVSTKRSQADAQNFMLKHLEVDFHLMNTVFPKMRPDEISMLAKTDKLICEFGARYLKIRRGAHFVNVVSRKMRELARLVIEIRKYNPELKTLMEILNPIYFDLIVSGTKAVAKYDEEQQTYKSPTYATNIITSLKQCCDIALTIAQKNSSVSAVEIGEVKALIRVFNANLKCEISSQSKSND